MIDLIYCAGANKRLTQIAYDLGYIPGVRSDKLGYDFPIGFVDIDYKKPNFDAHVEIVKKYRPRYATVPDLSESKVSNDDIQRALDQSVQLAPYCDTVLIIPKLPGQIAFLPDTVAVGYSLPTSYGGAQYPLWELAGRRVHLLGGSPHDQIKMYRYIQGQAAVISADGNMAQLMAIKYAKYWQRGRWVQHTKHSQGIKDLYIECWRLSCENIRSEWLKEFSPCV